MTKLDEKYNQTERNETYQTILVQDPEVRAEPKDQNLPHPDFLATRGYFLRFLRGLLLYPSFSNCEKSFLEVKNVSSKSKSLKNDPR